MSRPKTNNRRIQVHIGFIPPIFEELKNTAGVNNRSLPNMVEYIVIQYLQEQTKKSI